MPYPVYFMVKVDNFLMLCNSPNRGDDQWKELFYFHIFHKLRL